MVMVGGSGDLNPRGAGPGQGGGGGGGNGGPASNPVIQGAARDLSCALSADQQTLKIMLTPNAFATYVTGANYAVYWLDPTVYSYNDIYGGLLVGPNGLLPLASRIKVCDISGGDGIVYYNAQYANTYLATGGWLYAVAIPYNGTKEYRLDGTNFVSVPVIGASGQPSVNDIPVLPWVTITNQGGTKRMCQFGWNNALGQGINPVAYVKISMNNYFNDGLFQDIAIFKVNTSPGARQGVPSGAATWPFQGNSAILEPDNSVSPGHALKFYFVPMTAALVALPYASCNHYDTTAIV
jgi:hypothetical protein